MYKILILIWFILSAYILPISARIDAIPAAAATRTATATPIVKDISADLSLVDTINKLRSAAKKKPYTLNQGLQFLAASRAYLALAGIDLGTNPIPTQYFTNYSWSEYSTWADTSQKYSVTQALATLQQFKADLTDSDMIEIGAVWVCTGKRCAVVVIIGRAL